MNYIILLGAFQSIAAFGLFAWNNNKKHTDHILSWLLAAIFTHLSIKFMIYAVLNNKLMQSGFNTFIDLAYGPLIWLFVKNIHEGNRIKKVNNRLLFLPAFLAAVSYISISTLMLFSPDQAAAIKMHNSITSYFIVSSLLYYSLKSLLLCRKIPVFWKMEKQLVTLISSMFFLPGLFLGIIIFFKLTGHSDYSVLLEFPARILFYTFLLIICLAIVGYKVLSMKYLSSVVELNTAVELSTIASNSGRLTESKNTVTPSAPEIIRKQVLSSAQQASLIEKVNAFMKGNKSYVNPDLTLDGLAMEMKASRNHISEALNQYLGKSFYQFINEQRIKEVVLMMDIHKQQHSVPNILSLAFEAGFNSKSSFNQYFKKVVGCTPSEYLKKSQEDHNNALLFFSNS